MNELPEQFWIEPMFMSQYLERFLFHKRLSAYIPGMASEILLEDVMVHVLSIQLDHLILLLTTLFELLALFLDETQDA